MEERDGLRGEAWALIKVNMGGTQQCMSPKYAEKNKYHQVSPTDSSKSSQVQS